MIQIIHLKTMRRVAPPPATVLCLGNFDGVHLGHRQLIEETKKRKEFLSVTCPNVASGIWFFRDHTSLFLSGKAVPQITTLEDKLLLFADLGLDYAFLADFPELRNFSPTDFIKKVLCEECHCIFAVCGYNFRFGANASGDAAELIRLMEGNGVVLDPVMREGVPINSSTVRRLIAEGKTEEANRLLGHPYFLRAEVIHGKSLGHALGFPTINQLFPPNAQRPANGVYISGTWINNLLFPSITNVGIRPSFENTDTVNCETHIVDHSENLYGKVLRVDFYKRLRGEIRFSSTAEFTSQIAHDTESAKNYFQIGGGLSE